MIENHSFALSSHLWFCSLQILLHRKILSIASSLSSCQFPKVPNLSANGYHSRFRDSFKWKKKVRQFIFFKEPKLFLVMTRVFHENCQKFVSPDWPEITQIDRTERALQHIKNSERHIFWKKVIAHRKIAKKSIKMSKSVLFSRNENAYFLRPFGHLEGQKSIYSISSRIRFLPLDWTFKKNNEIGIYALKRRQQFFIDFLIGLMRSSRSSAFDGSPFNPGSSLNSFFQSPM